MPQPSGWVGGDRAGAAGDALWPGLEDALHGVGRLGALQIRDVQTSWWGDCGPLDPRPCLVSPGCREMLSSRLLVAGIRASSSCCGKPVPAWPPRSWRRPARSCAGEGRRHTCAPEDVGLGFPEGGTGGWAGASEAWQPVPDVTLTSQLPQVATRLAWGDRPCRSPLLAVAGGTAGLQSSVAPSVPWGLGTPVPVCPAPSSNSRVQPGLPTGWSEGHRGNEGGRDRGLSGVARVGGWERPEPSSQVGDGGGVSGRMRRG